MYKRCGYFFLAVIISLIPFSFAYSSDDLDTLPVDESKYKPIVKLSSNSTIEIQHGKTQDFIIEVKNVGTGHADNFFIQVLPGPEDPFTASASLIGSSTTIHSGASKQIKLTVAVDPGAAGKVYPIKLNYSYINSFRNSFDGSDTLNIKVLNTLSAANIRLYDFALEPASLNAGETGELAFNYMNMGAVTQHNVKISLEGLDPSAITVPDGLNSISLTTVPTYEEEKASFKIKASPALKNGVYPIKIVTTVKNHLGETSSEELNYFVNVGGEQDVGNASLDVINLTVPSETFSVGESFSIGFSLVNTSKADAENVIVKAEAIDGNPIVPTSQSMFMTRSLKAGETKQFSFKFAATSAAKSQNYPITFSIEYDAVTAGEDGANDKIKFAQYAGVNIFNPEKEEEGDGETDRLKNVPKIIVSSYDCDPVIVKAGSEFNLNMTFMNTHAEKQVKNIKASLTVTDKDEKIGASIFSPVNASNTLFVDQIDPKQTVTRRIRYYAVPNANPQNYSINVNFEYEDASGNEIKAQEIIGVNVSQPPRVETSEIIVTDYGEIGVPVQVNFDIYNTGSVMVNNVKAVLEGEMEASGGKTFWIGNLDKGQSEYVEFSFYYYEPGQQTGRIVVKFDSPTGEQFELPTDFSISINEPPPMDFDYQEEPPPELSFSDRLGSSKSFAVGLCIALIAAVGGFFGFKYYKKIKKSKDEQFFNDED